MTATTETTRSGASGLESAHLTAGGILRSEWVKLLTLRSTWWGLGVIAALTIGIPPLISLALTATGDGSPVAGGDVGYYNWVMATTLPVGFTVLVAAVLGCLVITGEYGTGMIRSSMAADPRRLGVLWAKALVIGCAVFVVGAVSLALGAAAAGAVLGGAGFTVDYADGRVWLSLLAAAGYPALIAVFSVGVGTILRNSAGAIASVLGLLLVVPTILQLVGALLQQVWVLNVSVFLPSSLGSTMYTPTIDTGFGVADGLIVLEPLQATLALLVWVAAALLGGALLLKRRDV